MREALQEYVKRVGELAEHVRGNEQSTKQSLVGPLFTILGYDLTDPRECIPEYRVDFRLNRSVKPANRKPVPANAINEWARQRTLTAVLDNSARSEPRSGGKAAAGERIETTQEELAAFEVIRRLLGPTRPVAYEDTVSYFKIHPAERYTWVMCRLYLGRKRSSVWVPLPQEQVQSLTSGLMLSTPQEGWTCITLNASGEIERLGEILRAAWDSQKAIRTRKPETSEAESAGSEGDSVPAETESAIVAGEYGPGDLLSGPSVG
jgi:hypothetical protein